MENIPKKGRTRREFLKGAGAVVAGGVVAGVAGSQLGCGGEAEQTAVYKAPLAEGYLVYDTKKCSGCTACMLTCSLVHEGRENLSLARLQIVVNKFGRFPEDIKMQVCRQCVIPPCVLACPTGALHTDADNGNVRTIDEAKCIGCKLCMEACPYIPHRPTWNHEKGISIKCDLCADTPYFSEKGGVNGKQACVEVCPMQAIKLVKEVPSQLDSAGYDVNLRNENAAAIYLDLD